MAFFYRHNPKKFNYIPRYYNPEEQAWEEKKVGREKGRCWPRLQVDPRGTASRPDAE